MHRSSFRFSIRDVLWLTLAVGLALSWVIDRNAVNQRWQSKAARLEKSKDEYRQHSSELANEARYWETSAGALERIMEEEGYIVSWRPDYVATQGYWLNRHTYKPSPPQKKNLNEFVGSSE